MYWKMWAVVLAVAALTWTGLAQDKPNFSGTWKLNVDKSDFGPVPGPSVQTDVIEQNGQNIKINVSAETEAGKKEFTVTYVTDGKEVALSADAPAAHPAPEVTLESISAAWEGATLVVNQKLTYGDQPVTGVSRYTLSPDGKVLTISSEYASQMGDASRTFVFEKVDSGTAGVSAMAAPAAAASPAPSKAMASSSTSSAKPNFTGIWVLDASKSDFGQIPPPDSRTDTIEHKEPSFKVSVNQTGGPMGQMTFTVDLVTDGKTVSKWTVFGSDAKSTAHWEGNTLVAQTDAKIQDQSATFVSKYTLGSDGNTLDVQGHFSGPMGEGDTKLVFVKKQ
jgi:hypothetical protein